MKIDERIERRIGYDDGGRIVVDAAAISPVVHAPSPIGRGPDLERLLDALDPAFSGSLPPSIYVHGPKGSGKSAVVTALFERLSAHGGRRRSIQTSTRAVDPPLPEFVHVDVRRASTRFRLYHDLQAAIGDERVPEHGIGTDDLAASLGTTIRTGPDVVVALDHVDEHETPDAVALVEWLSTVSDRIMPVCIGRDPPPSIAWDPGASIALDRYRHHVLVELLTTRISTGLDRNALAHDQIREVVNWAAGDAHDALAAVMGAAWHAERAGAVTVGPDDLDAGMAAVPKPCVALGRVLALPENRRRLCYELASLDESARGSVNDATEAIAGVDDVDLTTSTVRRILYELADAGLLDRVPLDGTGGKGRPPSRLDPRFPTLVYRTLFERR